MVSSPGTCRNPCCWILDARKTLGLREPQQSKLNNIKAWIYFFWSKGFISEIAVLNEKPQNGSFFFFFRSVVKSNFEKNKTDIFCTGLQIWFEDCKVLQNKQKRRLLPFSSAKIQVLTHTNLVSQMKQDLEKWSRPRPALWSRICG